MSTTTYSPPEGLPTGQRIYAALVLPFGEPAHPSHEDAGRVFRWGDVRLPRREVPVDVGHDQQAVGLASSFHLTRDGIWCSIKLGTEGERLVQRGASRLSAEIDENAEIIAVSLVVTGTPAFASAGLYTPDGHRPTADFAATPGVHISEGSVSLGPSHPTEPVRTSRPGSGLVRNESMALFGPAPEVEAKAARARWRSHVAELAGADAAEEERRLIAQVVPMRQWPTHLPGRRAWEAREALHQAEIVRAEGEAAARAFAERMEQLEERAKGVRADGEAAARAFKRRMEQLEAAATRRPWWRSLRRVRMSEDNVEIAPGRIEFEIKVLPPEPEPVISAEEEQHAYLEGEARRRAGVHTHGDLHRQLRAAAGFSSWPERYREAFSDELARLRAAARPPVG